MDDFMLMMMESDFNVSILSKNEDSALMAGIRITHYHFVEHKTVKIDSDMESDNPNEGTIQNTYHQGARTMDVIGQHHIPRYQLAQNFEMLFEMKWDTPDRPLVAVLNRRMEAVKFSEDQFAFNIDGSNYSIDNIDSEGFINEIKKDVRRLKKAKSLIEWNGEKCFLENFKTPGGKKIASIDGNDSLIEAIAFELLLFKEKRIKPRLGIYTLYSIMQDEDYILKDEKLLEFIDSLIYVHRNDEDGYFRNLIERCQASCFSEPLFKQDETPDRDKLLGQIKMMYSSMKPFRKVQLYKMEPYNGITFLLCFTFVLDEFDLYEFNDLLNKSYQPDSKSEQNNRYETNLLKLFGSFFKTYN